jgi:hypothetical protein
LKLSIHNNNALEQPHQVANLQEIITTVDRAEATIAVSMETKNLKIATWLFHGDGDKDKDNCMLMRYYSTREEIVLLYDPRKNHKKSHVVVPRLAGTPV